MIPNEQELLSNLEKISYTLDKNYLSQLADEYEVLPFDKYTDVKSMDYVSNIRALRIKRWVYDKDENIRDCFKNVLSIFANSDNSIALVLQRNPRNTEMFFVVQNTGLGRNEDSKNNIDLLYSSLIGNFPGTNIEVIHEADGGNDTQKLFPFDKAKSISVLCSVPSEKSENYISQGIEKLLNGVVPATDDESYSVVILAEGLSQTITREILSGYEELATAMAPFSGYQFQVGHNKSETSGEMKMLADTQGTSKSISKTHAVTVGASAGVSIPIPGVSVGAFAAYTQSRGKTTTTSVSTTNTTGTNRGVALGESDSTTYTYKSYMVNGLIAKIEATIKRINESKSNGLWKCAAYVLSADAKTSKNVANFLRSISQGDASFIEPAVVQEWSAKAGNEGSKFNEIQKYLQHFAHPVFGKSDYANITATSNISTSELTNIISFPRYSIQGVPVLECTRFGREAHSLVPLKCDLSLGCSYHMYQEEKQNLIYLNKNELTKHTFITGSTGSGKSNTIYKILSELNQQKVTFLVIEPTKGEYKNIFGYRNDVSVYGTNPNITSMLRINPFKFPPKIHVLEHLDRLIEIFNVCWPMYAAMPAILKDAVERAYIAAGWDLKKSQNKYHNSLFPTFADVLAQIRVVLNDSDYSADNKGDYIGALATRVKSLTNGINGMIFTQNDLPDNKLFDENVIVDLSRVGSTETKALIMGLLVMKLQEYRMTSGQQNADLTHITVLEEAHNLLKRTSTEQSSDGSNLLGKSVEMLANAIAEMRTYGEGFIIADQSPGLLDMSVIRNTNTKIILRLPDLSDRELVGKAAGLNDNQIIELSKLPRGVAAVSQSDWLEPILCKVDKFDAQEGTYINPDKHQYTDEQTQQSLLKIIMDKEIYRRGDRVDMQQLSATIIHSDLNTSVKSAFIEYLNSEDENDLKGLRTLVYEFFDAKHAVDMSKNNKEIEDWAVSVANHLNPSINNYSKQQIELVLALIIHEQAQRDASYNDLMICFAEQHKLHSGGVV